jgi:hypothetical protein
MNGQCNLDEPCVRQYFIVYSIYGQLRLVMTFDPM